MRYSDDIIEEVRMKNDIVDVVSHFVNLTVVPDRRTTT